MGGIENYVERACSHTLYQPDLSLNMEICDIINQKEKSYPRDAAKAIIKKVNSRSTHVSLLALALLDNCVKNCGYPFHLQIASREFLNELVKKFPDSPPADMPPNMRRILELIQEWKCTISQHSTNKADLRLIDDMYQLLVSKGYRFPSINESSAAVLGTSKQIKSPEELELEDRKAKSAKLQELIRRGTPAALAEANELMKVMAGYDIEKRPDYKKQTSEELGKISAKAQQLLDFTRNPPPGESFDRSPTVRDLVTVCESNQPKLQKMIAEDDGENMGLLLSVNDLVNQALKAYAELKGDSGSPAAFRRPAGAAGAGGPGGSRLAAPQKKDDSPLIDLDFFGGPPAAPAAAPQSGFGYPANVGQPDRFGAPAVLPGNQGFAAPGRVTPTPGPFQTGNQPAGGGSPAAGAGGTSSPATGFLMPGQGNIAGGLSGLDFQPSQPIQWPAASQAGQTRPPGWGAGNTGGQPPQPVQWGAGGGIGQAMQPAQAGPSGAAQFDWGNAAGGLQSGYAGAQAGAPVHSFGFQGAYATQPSFGTGAAGGNLGAGQGFAGSPRPMTMATGFASPQLGQNRAQRGPQQPAAVQTPRFGQGYGQ